MVDVTLWVRAYSTSGTAMWRRPLHSVEQLVDATEIVQAHFETTHDVPYARVAPVAQD